MKTYIKIALGVVLFIALAGIGVGIHLFRMTHKDLGGIKPDYVITAIDLQKVFEDNESVATVKYVKKIIEVSGTIESIKPGENNIINITLKTGNDMSSVICTLTKNTDPLKLSEGSDVTIRGECSGFLMDVLLNNCALIKQGK